jgi:hypothetical protein
VCAAFHPLSVTQPIVIRYTMDITAVPQTKAERVAFVNQMFAGMQPADKKADTLLAQLKPLRSELLVKRREGYTLRQIAEALKTSRLKCTVSPATIRALLTSAAAKRRAKMNKLAKKRAANLAAMKATAAGSPVAPR